MAGNKDDLFGNVEEGRKKTTEGYNVYNEDELKWNLKSSGGTALCPFDCSCCH